MAAATENGVVTIALLGNPNTGKSTVFNALAGVRQRVGNYPGVTVEKRTGKAAIEGREFNLVDLPGTYSLAPRSLDEMVTVDVLLGRTGDGHKPDIILCVVDASNLERNLYLVSQALELECPVVVALNMVDVAEGAGISVDADRLQEQLGLPVIPTQANRRIGLDDLREALRDALRDAAGRAAEPRKSPFPPEFCREVDGLAGRLQGDDNGPVPRFLIERLLLDVGGYLDRARLPELDAKIRSAAEADAERPLSRDAGEKSGGEKQARLDPAELLRSEIDAARQRLARSGCEVPGVETASRYAWIEGVLSGVESRTGKQRTTWSDRIDRLLLHKVAGTTVFAVLMVLLFQTIFSWSSPAMAGIETVVGLAGDWVGGLLTAGALQSLLVDGVIGGVGGVLVFLPQILLLFLFIAVLEDCGYMSRAAYLADRWMVSIGLSGKSFIPLLSSFACAVPGVMAARTIENRRDRLVTILIAPLMSCSARLPVYVLLIAAFIPDWRFLGGWLGLQGITMTAMYLVGVVTAVFVALILKSTVLQEPTPAFVMELPSYKVPSLRNVCQRVCERGWRFVRQAGTLILAASIIVWALAYYPRASDEARAKLLSHKAALEANLQQISSSNETAAATPAPGDSQLAGLQNELDAVNNDLRGLQMQQSYLGRMGRLVEPVVQPLGWDWRIGCAVIASFPAREVVISTLGVIYNLGDEQDEESEPLREKLQGVTWDGTNRPVFNVPVALSIMVFFALCAQCAATLAVIRRETNSWRWPLFTFTYMTGLAYLAALATYQIGMWIAG